MNNEATIYYFKNRAGERIGCQNAYKISCLVQIEWGEYVTPKCIPNVSYHIFNKMDNSILHNDEWLG